MDKEKLRSFLDIVLILIMFLVVSYTVQSNINFFENLLKYKYLGVLIYILIVQLAIIFAPLSSMPLIPLASQLWGPFYTSIINLFSWTLGCIIVFFISRKWGAQIVGKLISLKKLHKIENKIPRENQFWSIVFLRMFIPVDILSYILGILSNVKTKDYILGTFIGLIPFVFILSYIGYLPFIYQLILLLLVAIIILTGFIFKKIKKSK